MGLSDLLASKFPGLKEDFKKADISMKPAEYVSKNLRSSLFMALMIALVVFFSFSKNKVSFLVIVIVFLISFGVMFWMFMNTAKVRMMKRGKQMERDVLFAGRFLLIKLRSGKPLVNSLVDASKSYGVANDFFKGIVKEIELGTPLEKALSKAADNCPSDNFRRILFQINNALKIGVDVTNFLEAILEDISNDQLVEIEKYGKKLSGITMFYMLLAVVLPSLGMSMFIIMSSMMSININIAVYAMITFFLVIIELLFISIFRNIRPNVNI